MAQALKKVVVAGGTGLVGRALVEALVAAGTQVEVVTRNPALALPPGAQALGWESLPKALEGADAVINLAGEGIADKRWNPARKAAILASRLTTTNRLVEALGRAASGPKVLVNASAMGYYGAHGGEVVDETGAKGKGFLPDVCAAWEQAADQATAHGVRVVKLRIGVVLAKVGGALPKMAFPVKIFQGTKLGHGQQGLSWIHLDDLVAMLVEAAADPTWSGVYNATAPQPLSNETFTRVLGKVLHRPILPVPGFVTAAVLPLLVGEMAEPMLLQGAYVYPRRAERQGFTFRFPDALSAVQDLLA
ncbi:MAG TPA: TIGR01777 family oxidoreductase [Holophagaceae bacterium]|nr:TIGR01777 family oxidoreductase [Geothrix sp.]HJW33159.1 TIGR01777 family oxidoreductase [Holophagaceae bacterium]